MPVCPVTQALEDYLETIFLLIKDKKVARIRDIAEVRKVKPGSVTPAMKRLAELGLINYTKREFIQLTDEGLDIARKTLTRHRLLERFLTEILHVGLENARNDACAMEHNLSDETTERFARFFEFLHCSYEARQILEDKFHRCIELNSDRNTLEEKCPCFETSGKNTVELRTILQMQPGELGLVARINADRKMKIKLLNKGLIPETGIKLLFQESGSGKYLMQMNKTELELTAEEAGCVMIS